MPTYEYKCSSCGQKFEKFQSITAAPIKKCPHCGKNTAQRLIGTGAGLIFKGSGFYITDYRSEGYKEKAKAEGGETKKSDGGEGGASTEAKPSEKKESTPASKATEPKKAGPKPPGKSSEKKSV